MEASASKAELFSSPGQKLSAYIQNANVAVELTGVGGGNFEAKLPKALNVSEGDSVFLPGAKTMLLGIVSGTTEISNDSYEKVQILVPVNLFELSHVFVEKDSSLPLSPRN